MYVAKVLGRIFANPPYYIVRCLVSDEKGIESIVVKGKIVGEVNTGSVFTFNGVKKIDKKTLKFVIEVTVNPINPKRLKGSALSHWAEWSTPFMEARMELAGTLAEAGVNIAVLNSLWSQLDSPEGFMENPWCLVKTGVDFNSADEIAKAVLKQNYQYDNPHRIEASIFWSLLQGVWQGHTHLNSNTIFKDTAILTGVSNPQDIALAIKAMRESDPPRIIIENCGEGKEKALFLPSYYRMENTVANLLTSPIRERGVSPSIEEIKSYTRYPLTDTQLRAVQQGLEEPCSIITGLPGTGKTTILNTLCKILEDQGESVLLVAPTGIASKRASELTGLEAMTIHRAFGAGIPQDESEEQTSDYEGVKKDLEKEATKVKPIGRTLDPTTEVWKHSIGAPRTESVVIIDEASMVDLHLMWRLMQGISPKCRVVMVGDIEQLPPVGAGFVLYDLIQSEALPRIHLNEIFRQGEGSGIAISAHQIHKGLVPQPNQEYVFIDRYSSQDILETLVETCKELHLEDKEFHVVSPTHHGKVGVTNLNRELRSALNPTYSWGSDREVKAGKESIRVGDRIMITRNEYDLGVYNGDVGRVEAINKGSVDVVIKGVKDQRITLPMDAVGKLLRLAYATTVHKSQGLEYDVIVMPMSVDHPPALLQRSLLYTAITRAKEKVILIGDREAVAICVSNVKHNDKFSRLKYRFEKIDLDDIL